MVELKEVSAQECEGRLAQNPQSLIFSRLADCYRKRGDIQRAIDVCSQGLGAHPESITGRVILGRCYLEQEKYQEAAVEFTKVIERDRRNQVALKMLADVFSHQGMTEKAGDIYSFLLTIDPGNQSLVSLSAQTSGSGETNIYRVLGFSEPSREQGDGASKDFVSSGDEQPVQTVDSFQDPDKAFAQTMPMDPQELKQGFFNRQSPTITQRGPDIEELGPSIAPRSESGVEELIGDLPASNGLSVSGDDITARMSMMFKEEENASEIAQSPTKLDNRSLSDAFAENTENQPDSPTMPESVIEEVSGNDISSRIEQLFGESSREAAEAPMAEAGGDFTQMFDSSSQVAEPSPGLEPMVAYGEEEELADLQVAKGGQTDVSGEDIVSRMSEIFEKTAEVVGQISEAMGKNPLPENDSAVIPETGVMPDDSESASLEVAETIEGGAISGDDIARRLETIFEEEESVSPSAAPLSREEENPVLTVTQKAEPTISESADVAEVLQTPIESSPLGAADIENSDIAPFIEQATTDEKTDQGSKTEINGIAALTEASTDEFNGLLDDVVPSEESPDMSGDDVRSRLEEIFPDSLLAEETLSVVSEIPEGEKDDETPNQGFYTMSGEDAVAKIPDDSLLKQLDEVEIDLSSNDTKRAETSITAPPQFDSNETADGSEAESVLGADSSQAPHTSEIGNLSSIPDHVLTPTLADIYFQQGQPHLAVQIYSRLLEKDPDNERIAKRLEKIKSFIASNPQLLPALKPEAPRQPEVREPEKKPAPQKISRKKSAATPKPLAGVRIKKKKNRRIL